LHNKAISPTLSVEFYLLIMEIEKIIEAAFKQTRTKEVTENNDLKRNRQRSINWVESLAEQLRISYPDKDNYRVFSKYYSGNQDFGLNELLFDISVVKINKTESPRHRELTYIEKALWLVESEMAKDTRQMVHDFNKLVVGNSENKLFVGPLTKKIIEFLPELVKVANHCNGNLFLCLIPHPSAWGNEELKPFIYSFSGDSFINLKKRATFLIN
jgi:hypothetical protein